MLPSGITWHKTSGIKNMLPLCLRRSDRLQQWRNVTTLVKPLWFMQALVLATSILSLRTTAAFGSFLISSVPASYRLFRSRAALIRSQQQPPCDTSVIVTRSHRQTGSRLKRASTTQLWWHQQRILMSSSCFASTGANSSTRLEAQFEAHHIHRDADLVEMMIGGERYSLVPMPDPMKSTTLFVGNLCEFVRDHDLSSHFSQVSSLATVPSCVVRKVNTQSMGYGFVSFPSVQEKEVRTTIV
jgi:RNA recognition motif. (a.k.a. RRM, RBD, or RNP domain)